MSRRIPLGDHGEDLSPLDQDRAVEQLAESADGHTQRGQHFQIARSLQNSAQAILRALQQSVMQEEIAAGVSCQTQLRQRQDLDALTLRLTHHGKDLFGVVPAIRHADGGRTGSNRDKTIFHKNSLLAGKIFMDILPRKT